MDNKESVVKVFTEADKPLKAGEVAEIVGIEKSQVDKVIKKLKTEEVIYSPKRCYYEIKK